jgi:hypothetical protein
MNVHDANVPATQLILIPLTQKLPAVQGRQSPLEAYCPVLHTVPVARIAPNVHTAPGPATQTPEHAEVVRLKESPYLPAGQGWQLDVDTAGEGW